MSSLWHDLRYATRTLAKAPCFSFVVVVTIALGIGANTAIFSVVDHVVLRPLPYPDSERLAHVTWRFERGEAQAVSEDKFLFWREHAEVFEEVAAFDLASSGFNLTGREWPERVQGLRTSEGLFRTLGVEPALGRSFVPTEDIPGAPRVAVLSHGLWQRRYGGDPDALGKPMFIDGDPYTVVGIMPADFHFSPLVDVWIPLQPAVGAAQLGNSYAMIARVKPGNSFSQAQSDLDGVTRQFRETYPDRIGPRERGIAIGSYRARIVGSVGSSLWILLAAVGFVLLIACANVANLLLARGSARNRELAIRSALGAGRWRLFRQLLTENVVLGLAGGIIGMVAAYWSVPVLVSLRPESLPRAAEVVVDGRIALFALAVSLLTGILFGFVPALRASRGGIAGSLQEDSGRSGEGKRGSRFRGCLVVAEVALALVLLVGAALLMESFRRLRAIEPGFDPRHVLTMKTALTSERFQTTAALWQLQQDALERIRSIPGVEQAGTTSSLPTERGLNIPLTLPGAEPDSVLSVEYRSISPEYLSCMRIPIRHGRSFTTADMSTGPQVAIINRTLARMVYRNADPIGRKLLLGMGGFGETPREVVGVVGDTREFALHQPAPPTVFVPQAQMSDQLTALMNQAFPTAWVVRASSPLGMIEPIRRLMRIVDPQQPISDFQLMSSVVQGSIGAQQFNALLMTGFGTIAMVLTAVGIYGVLSYQVSRRTREIGIRMALGARQTQIWHMVVGQGLLLTGVGIVLGLLGARALTNLLEAMLYEISPTEPVAFATAPLLVLAVASVAAYIPARRATKVDPMVALRCE